MIDTTDIDNWGRWEAKERRGVNRGYAQAYRNTRRADHFVLISERDSPYNDEVTVTVKPCTHGNWKSGRSDESQTFEGHESKADVLLADAETYARDWMRDHPCDRAAETDRDAVELLTDLFGAMEAEGLVIQHDCGVNGWTRPGHMDSTTHNIRAFVVDEDEEELQAPDDPTDSEVLSFSISLDGKLSGLSYREFKECDSDGEVRQMHEPRNQSALHGDIEAAFRAVGFKDIHVKNGGHQRHWDHDVSYRIRAYIPDDFDLALRGAKQEQSRRRRI